MIDRKRRRLLGYLLGSTFLAGSGLLLGNRLTGAQARARQPLLSAARDASGQYSIRIFNAFDSNEIEIPLPARAHELVPHPQRPEAICIARRPGLELQRFDYASGQLLQRIAPPADRRFYGHGVFSPDGAYFYATENNFAAGCGVIGVYAATQQYRRIGELESHGVGPHQLKLLPDGQTLVVANGGIQTHPDSGREKLNLETMAPNLAYLDRHSGDLLERHHFAHHQLSIRHLDVGASGEVAFGMQYQGDDGAVHPLVARHRRGQPVQSCQADVGAWRQLNGYIASVLLLEAANTLVVSAPRGNRLYFWNLVDNCLSSQLPLTDCAGLAALAPDRLIASSGRGELVQLQVDAGRFTELERRLHPATQWDNHLSALASAPA